jgi:hypothetical protein
LWSRRNRFELYSGGGMAGGAAWQVGPFGLNE